MAKYRLAVALAPLALAVSPAALADWTFGPSMHARLGYSDNLYLSAPGSERGGWIADLAPGFTAIKRGPRFRFDADYRLYYFGRSGAPGDSDHARSQLASRLNAELAENWLYFDAAANISQQSISPFGPLRRNDEPGTANQAEVRSYSLSPYLNHRFGGTATLNARYTRDSVSADRGGLNKSDGDSVSVALASGSNFDDFGWTLSASEQRVDFELAPESVTRNAALSLRQALGRTLALTASAGYDSYNYQALSGATEGDAWTAGFSWTPSSRTRVDANAGRRFYGSTYYLSANYRSRRTVWNLSYNDDVTTSREQFLLPATVDTATMLDQLFTSTIPDPAARQQAVDAYLRVSGLPPSLARNINYFSNRHFLQKQFQASMAYRTARSRMVVSAFDTRRTALSADAAADAPLEPPGLVGLNDITRQTGVSVLVDWSLNTRTSVSATLNATRVDSTKILDADHKSARLALTHKLQQKLNGTLELRRSSGPTADLRSNYRENAISASLTKLF